MNGFWTPAIEGAANFFKAWGNALVTSAPQWLQPHLATSRAPLQVAISSLEDFGKQAERLQGHDLNIVLDPSLTLEHKFRISGAAAGEIKRVATLEAARVMPISIEKLVTSYRVTKDEETSDLSVCLVAARRTLVENITARAQKHQLSICSVGTQTSAGAVTFRLPTLQRRKRIERTFLVTAIVSALFIASTAPSFYLSKLNQHVSETDQAIHKARTRTIKIAGLQQQVKSLQNLANAVQEVHNQSQVVDLLAALTKASPDDVVIDEFNLNGDRLRISGRANSPEDWVIKLQKDPAFADVRLTSVLGQSKGEKRRFEVHMTVQWPSERSQS
ncbi:PilN domain-containing protein [Kordiimonas marina]|uniref:PilN domain-containing protein n=1 Tax=Kordiimonas marina TaxID=2872312 RepID=UPI001FF3A04C|nr:PilN domain-containing protein [Kordiimonas marina]MCJ9430036.1 PilN domain-containing protein [Kordiimonas marina]